MQINACEKHKTQNFVSGSSPLSILRSFSLCSAREILELIIVRFALTFQVQVTTSRMFHKTVVIVGQRVHNS